MGTSIQDILYKNLFCYNQQQKTTIKLATMFSGIGAIEFAFKRLNIPYDLVFACDNDKFVKKSYFENYNIKEDNWYSDVKNINGNKYKNGIDLLVGGSPCQSFSIAGKRRGFEDTRGSLFYEFARIVKECQPKIFIYENVKGLINHDKGNTFEIIKATFDELGYKYFFKLLNAKDYGLPQYRERVFIVGFKDTEAIFEFPNIIPLKSTMQDFLEDFIDTEYYLNGVKYITNRENLLKQCILLNYNINFHKSIVKKLNWNKVIFTLNCQEIWEFKFNVNKVIDKYYLSKKLEEYVLASGTKKFKICSKTDLPIARTLLQSMHKMHRAGIDNYVTHSGRIRKLTPRECLRLMGFSDDFKIVVSDTQMYRQTGNSIAVNVLMAILKQIAISNINIIN